MDTLSSLISWVGLSPGPEQTTPVSVAALQQVAKR